MVEEQQVTVDQHGYDQQGYDQQGVVVDLSSLFAASLPNQHFLSLLLVHICSSLFSGGKSRLH